jgi:hypothetical protein
MNLGGPRQTRGRNGLHRGIGLAIATALAADGVVPHNAIYSTAATPSKIGSTSPRSSWTITRSRWSRPPPRLARPGVCGTTSPWVPLQWSAVNAALVALRVERLPLGSERRYWGRAAP